MSNPLVVVDSSEIHEGKPRSQGGTRELAEFVEANEAAPLAYNIYFSEDGTRMTVVQVHPDSESMELHMSLAGPLFRRFTGLVELSRVDFYGTPSEAVLGAMREKARLLGNAPVVVHELHAGFARYGEPARAGR